MLGRSLILTAGLALAATPAASAAAPSPCPASSTSGWAAVSTAGWIATAEGQVYAAAPQYDADSFSAFLRAVDRDGDGVICRQIGVLPQGTPPFYWPGYAPISFIDDAMH